MALICFLRKSKLYLINWSEISDEAKRFENFIASHLLKLVHFFYGYEGYRINLNFLRNADKKEKLNIPYCYQIVKKSGVDRLINGIRFVSADRFLCGLI
jgi:hypothetical protein